MDTNHFGRIELVETFARLDLDRRERTGIPETVLAEGKSIEQLVSITQAVCEKSGVVLVTRASNDYADSLQRVFQAGFRFQHNNAGRTVVIQRSDFLPISTGGCIAVVSAGTGDVSVAEEAKVTAEVMGCEVLTYYDAGVAGIHRLVAPIKSILEKDVAAVVVVAGMEGALPSIVRGLVPVPVIGVPTSVGYGYGAKGEAALMSMLQSCSPGMTVVNIDNGFGAGATAALIANRVAQANRRKGP